MSNHEQIEKAITAHSSWKVKLRKIITEGHSSISVNDIRADNRCEFGKWIQGPIIGIDPAAKAEIARLHADFHRAAAKVADAALHGKTKEAEAMMAMGGEYGVTSSKLTVAMINWKKKVPA